MPVPQENSLFVEQASCLFLRMVQDVSLYRSRAGKRERQRSLEQLYWLHLQAIVLRTLHRQIRTQECCVPTSIRLQLATLPLI